MASFKAKFASLVQELRSKKSREFSRQPQPAYAEHFSEVPPPPPPPVPSQFKTKSSSRSGVTTSIHAGGDAAESDKAIDRPPSRTGFSLRKIGSKASLKELKRRSSFGGKSTASLANSNEPPKAPQEAQAQELTPPPSAGKKSPPLTFLSQNHPTPPADIYDDLDDDLYSDPVADRLKAEAAAKASNHSDIGTSQTRPQPISTGNGSFYRPPMFIPGTNSQILPTIPASPASTMASPMTPVSTNPFRKHTAPSPKVVEVPISPVVEHNSATTSPKLTINFAMDNDPQTASPTTATMGLMNGLNFSFAPPPVDPLPLVPVAAAPSEEAPDAQLPIAKASIKAIAPPAASSAGPAVLPLDRTLSGKGPQFKKAPSGKTAVPAGFAPPPPPPMTLPAGWTARWDAKEQKFAYYQGTRSRTEQWEMPTEPAKKLSMRDRRMKKKKEVQENIANLASYAEASSPTTPNQPLAASSLVEPNRSS